MQRMAADREPQPGWRETDPCQLPLPDAAAKGKIWSDLTEIYYVP
jgi:L-rhamnose mutarotase